MQIDIASISDIQSIARREALNAGKKILGVTASQPRYVNIPDDDDEDAVLEFVVDVFLLESANQAVEFIAGAAGLKRIDNILIANAAVGDLIADLNTPVEIEKSVSGQLQVVSRAKIALPILVLDLYSYKDLSISHCAELIKQSDGTYRDPWGVPVEFGASLGATALRPQVGSTLTQTSALSTLGELGYTDDGLTDGQFGTNPLQRTITSTSAAYVVAALERIDVTELEA